MPSRRERIEGGVAGLLIGDTLGVPYEFHDPDEIPPVEQIEHEPLVEGEWRLGDADCPWIALGLPLEPYCLIGFRSTHHTSSSALDSTAQALYI